jgi:hypothetical protein
LIKGEARRGNYPEALTATYSQNQVAGYLVQGSKVNVKKFFRATSLKFKLLILKKIFSAFQRGNLLETAWQLGFLHVKHHFSTKLSTGFVDS